MTTAKREVPKTMAAVHVTLRRFLKVGQGRRSRTCWMPLSSLLTGCSISSTGQIVRGQMEESETYYRKVPVAGVCARP